MNYNPKYFSKHIYILSILFIYAVIISVISYHHEFWRDEVRALSIITDSNSFFDLYTNMQNEGHPVLWYFILYIGYSVTHNPEILRIIHLIIATISLYIFLKNAPFSITNIIIFIFGYYIIYEYAVICRNYSISMLLIFLYCALYKNRLNKIIPISIVLFLLANTNAHSIILSIVFFVFLIKDFIKEKKPENKISTYIFVSGCVFIFAGIMFAIYQVIPDKSTIATNLYSMSVSSIAKNISKAIIFPGESYRTLFGINNFVFTSILIWIIAISLVKKLNVFYIFIISLFGLSLFFKLVYPVMGPRHEGFLFLIIILSNWIEKSNSKEFIFKNAVMEQVSAFLYKKRDVILTFFLIVQVINSINPTKNDLVYEYSSAKALGNLLNESTELNDAIIMCEPDYLIESLPYYSDNPIYFIRENKFGLKVNFTTKSKSEIYLSNILEKAKQLRNLYSKNILLIFGYKLQKNGPFILNAGFSRKFIYSEEQFLDFSQNTKKITGFHGAITNENYDVYILK